MKSLECLVVAQGDEIQLLSPRVGQLVVAAPAKTVVGPASVLGVLRVLGGDVQLLVPQGVRGFVTQAAKSFPHAVDYKGVVATLQVASEGGDVRVSAAESAALEGKTFALPIGGRYYGRPAPDQPPFVAENMAVKAGDTVAIIEVMKTFNRVQYQGPDAIIKKVLIADGSDANAGDALLLLA